MFSAFHSAGAGLRTITCKQPGDGSPSLSTPMLVIRSGYLRYRRKSSSGGPNFPFSVMSVSSNGVGPEGSTLDPIKEEHRMKKSADWKAARAYKESGFIYSARVKRFNRGGLLVQFYSLIGFLPFNEMSRSHFLKDPTKSVIQKGQELIGSVIQVKVLQADEEQKTLIFSERGAIFSKHSEDLKIGAVFKGKVEYVGVYGAYVNLFFPNDEIHLNGFLHASEVSWDSVGDARDILHVGDIIRVQILHIDPAIGKIKLSMRQLAHDPLRERLDQVILQEGQSESDTVDMPTETKMERLPGLENVCNELLQEQGITDIKLGRQGLEKRVVSQNLEIWVPTAPAKGNHFSLLARNGRQVQEVHLTTDLDHDGIIQAVQRVVGRVL